jgi:glutaredoxin
MIDVIVSSKCSHCAEQEEIMDRYFFDDEYRIIDSGGDDFAGYKYASRIRSVPCIVVENDKEELIYAGIGVHSEERLRNIAFGEAKSAFVLRAERQDES